MRKTKKELIRELVDAAHLGAKEALVELRELVRGIHPPVLDTGLGEALATLAAGSAIPVTVTTGVPSEPPGRPSPAIETIAYFCAAELLANVAKHSGARRTTLEVVNRAGRLRVRVSDDGCGGAQVEARGGLAGLAASTVIQGTEFTLNDQSFGTYGIDAITVALLGRGRPLGVVWAGLLFLNLRAYGILG